MYEFLDQFEANVMGFIPSSYVRRRPTDNSKGNALMETEDADMLQTLIGMRKVQYARVAWKLLLIFY